MKFLSKLFKHRHRWKDTRLNAFYIAVEQRCKCGAARHHLFEDWRGIEREPNWRDGLHPETLKLSEPIEALRQDCRFIARALRQVLKEEGKQ